MSNRFLTAAFDSSKASGLVKYVLIYLANSAEEHGYCFPKISTIAKKCGISERTVQRSIAELIEYDELKIAEEGGAVGGQRFANLYRVLVGLTEEEKTEPPPVRLTRVSNRHRVTNRHPMGATQTPYGCHTDTPLILKETSVETKEEPPNPQRGDGGFFASAQKKKKSKLTAESVLDAIKSDLFFEQNLDFQLHWAKWVRNRIELPTHPTLAAFDLHMKTCQRLGPALACKAIDYSIANGYRAIFPEPVPKNGVNGIPKKKGRF